MLYKAVYNQLPLPNMFRNLSAKPFGVQILSFTLLCVLGAVLSMLASYIALQGTGYSLLQYQAVANYNTPQWVNATIRMQIASTICMFGLPALAFGFLALPNAKMYLGLQKTPKLLHVVLGVIALIFSYGLVAYLAQINKYIPMPLSFVSAETKVAAMTKALLNFKTIPRLCLTIFYIGLLPAIVEELFFRACLQNILIQHYSKAKAHYAILITAIIFALLHGQMQTVLPRIFLGMLLGYLYYFSGSIWVSIIAHFFNNALQVFANFLFKQHTIAIDFSENPTVSIWVALASAAMCLSLMYAIYTRKGNYIYHSIPLEKTIIDNE